MTLFDTTQTIKGWINSCTKSDQLDLCEEIVKEYVVNRFSRQEIPSIDLLDAKVDLENLIDERRLILASEK